MKKKYIFSDEDIQIELANVEKLRSQGKLEVSAIPDYYCKEQSPKSKTTNLALAILLGFLGIDRFYLGKTISAIVKLSFATALPLFLTLLAVYTTAMKNYETDMIMYFVLVSFIGTSFYIFDIVYAIWKPRDKQNRCIGGVK